MTNRAISDPHRLAATLPAFISVDVETAGPYPGKFALLSIGACCVAQQERTFYVELQPDRAEFSSDAMLVSGLSLDQLARAGTPPEKAMADFEAWALNITPRGMRPIMVAFNAAFDWMFINDYFHRYLGRNPFGHSALDIKALYMGVKAVPWDETTFTKISANYGGSEHLQHNALQDALEQGNLFHRILDELTLERQE